MEAEQVWLSKGSPDQMDFKLEIRDLEFEL
jgi:hypothetical protein